MDSATEYSNISEDVKPCFFRSADAPQGAAAPSLVFKTPESGAKVRRVALTKCSCRSVWCPDCFRSGAARRISRRLQEMDWQRVRHLMLSVDRDRYADGGEAYLAIQARKAIPAMIRNLNRVSKRGILRWLWVLEWHEDGFPHFHLICEVEKAGRAGMIGQAEIEKYWGEGIVYEEYVRSFQHWRNTAGYFGKAGYFESSKAQHQTSLPAWAAEWTRIIRRSGCSCGSWNDSGECEGDACGDREDESGEVEVPRVHRPYKMILESCGLGTRIRIFGMKGGVDTTFIADVPFSQVAREVDGFAFFPGVGLVRFCDHSEFWEVMKYFHKFNIRKGFENGI